MEGSFFSQHGQFSSALLRGLEICNEGAVREMVVVGKYGGEGVERLTGG